MVICASIVAKYIKFMTKKVATIDLKGKSYATVPTRIKEFRESCPNGLIETVPTMLPDGRIMFKARILKDKSDINSAEGTGHSIGGTKGDKDFEKLETIAVGRALAVLGFMASGDIASSEEMEEFLSDKEAKRMKQIQDIKDKVDKITKIEDLREYYKTVKGFGVEVDAYIMDRSKVLKEDKVIKNKKNG